MNNNLVIAIPNVAEISIENCEQKLVPNDKYIDFVYDLNNKMRIIGDVSKKKFLSEITFYDSEINKNIWLGASVNVACIAEITENFDATQKVITLSRVPVTSSLRLFDENNVRLKFHVTGNEVTLDVTENCAKPGGKIIAKYRPWLQMCVKNFVTKCKNFGFDVEQKILLEEV